MRLYCTIDSVEIAKALMNSAYRNSAYLLSK